MSLFSDFGNPNKYLYHYTKRDTALQHILGVRQIRLSPFASTNDPRESKDWSFDFVSKGNLGELDIGKHLKLKEDATRIAKHGWKVLCMTRDNPVVFATEPYKFFARGFGHPRMWAQYADNHQGVCLIFDRAVLDVAISEQLAKRGEVYRGEVRYENSFAAREGAFTLDYDAVRALGVESAVDKHVGNWRQHLFFEKAQDWAEEWEYRWVVRTPGTSHEFVRFGDALQGVVTGADFPTDHEALLKSLCQSLKVKWARLHWRNGLPSLIPLAD